MRPLVTLVCTLTLCMALAGCAEPQAIPYIVDSTGTKGVWIMPKGSTAPVDGYLMDEEGARWLLGRAGVPPVPGGRVVVPGAPFRDNMRF